MKKRILSYMSYMDNILAKDKDKLELDYGHISSQHLQQLAFFMHEREVHLYVMILFTLLAVGDFYLMVIAFSPGLVVLFLGFLVLLLPYIMHYYLLENSCQYMYRQYDEIQRRMDKDASPAPFIMDSHPYTYLKK